MNWTFLYVALIYFSSVLLIRRFLRFPWLAAAIFFLLVWAFLFGPLTLNQTHLPSDHILGMYPWRPFYGVEKAHNPQLNDVMLQMVPWAHQVRESWKAGDAPLWNAAAGTGYPLLANGQSSALSPLRLLGLPLNLAQSFAFEAALKLLAAMTFAFLYMSHRGRSAQAAGATAVSFGFCGFMMLWLYWSHSSVVAFVPALFLAIDLIAERPTARRAMFVACIFAVLLLNGHPESAAHAGLAGGLYAAWLLVPLRSAALRPGLHLAAGVGAGILLAAPFLLPFLEVIPFTQRFQIIQHQSLFPALSAQHLVPFVMPLFYGTERDRNIWGPGNTDELSGYTGLFAIVAWFAVLLWRWEEWSWRDATAFHLIGAPLFTATALGWPPLAPLLRVLPPFSMGANGRLRFVAAWCLAVVVGEAVHCLVTRRLHRPLLIGTAAAAACLSLTCLLNRFPSSEAVVYAAKAAIPGVVVLIVCGVVAFLRNSAIAVNLLLVAILVDLWSLGRPWYAPFGVRTVYPESPLVSELRRRVASCSGPCRIAGIYATFFPNAAAIFGFEDARAHDPMALGQPLGALRVYTGYTSDRYFGMLTDVRSPFLDYLNVRYLVTAPHEHYESARWVAVYRGSDGTILENRDVLPRFFAALGVIAEPGRARRLQRLSWTRSVVVNEAPDVLPNDAVVNVVSAKPRRFRLLVDAPRGAFVASSQPLFPGWKIRRGNQMMPAVAVNELFIGFAVPPGRHIVEVFYAPRSFRLGIAIAVVAAALMIAVLAIRRPGTRDQGRGTVDSIASE